AGGAAGLRDRGGARYDAPVYLLDLTAARRRAPGALVTTPLGAIHARVTGSGPPVVLLHGITESTETFVELQDALAPVATVHAVDLPGHGYSDIPARALSLDEMASWVEAYMAHAGLERAVVVGWSLGGGVALSLAARAPGRVAALVLLGAVGPRMPMPRGLGLLRLPLVAEMFTRALADPRFRRAALRDVYHRSFTPSGAVVDRYARAWRVRGRAAYLRSLMRGVDVAPLEACLGAVRAKTWVLHGVSDRIVPLSTAQHSAARLPDAALDALASTGHAPHLERPDAVRAAIEAALAHAARGG
ncbi:MAG: alpha/beta hydrolase, partial [Myxococcales bacterium]